MQTNLLDCINDYVLKTQDNAKKITYVDICEFDKTYETRFTQNSNYKSLIANGGDDSAIKEIYENRTINDYEEALDRTTAAIVQKYLSQSHSGTPESKLAENDTMKMKLLYMAVWLLYQQKNNKIPSSEEYAAYGMQENDECFTKYFGSNWKDNKKLFNAVEYRFARNHWAFLRQDYAIYSMSLDKDINSVSHYMFDIQAKIDAFCYVPGHTVKPVCVAYGPTKYVKLQDINRKNSRMPAELRDHARYLYEVRGWRNDYKGVHVITDENITTFKNSFTDEYSDERLSFESVNRILRYI